MRIAFFHINEIVPEIGGISKITYTLTKLFREKNHEVFLIGAKCINNNIKYDLNQTFLPDQENIHSKANIEYLNNYITVNKIDYIINQSSQNIDVINLLTVIKSNTSIKLISCIHNCILTPIKNIAYQKEYSLKKKHLGIIFIFLKNKFINKIIIELYKLKHKKTYNALVNSSNLVVSLCDDLQKELLEITDNKCSEKMKVIPNCFQKEESQSNGLDKQNIILWVGTIDFSVKRIDLMLKIWGDLYQLNPEWKLMILGDGPGFDEAKSLAANLKNIEFVGRVHPDYYYQIAKIVCITSTHESFSLVSVEGMSNNVVPVVFNSYPAAKDILDQGNNGGLITAFDIDEFKCFLNRIMNDEKLLDSLRLNGNLFVERYLPTIVYEKWHYHLNDLTNENRKFKN